jgi:hypothetical protein
MKSFIQVMTATNFLNMWMCVVHMHGRAQKIGFHISKESTNAHTWEIPIGNMYLGFGRAVTSKYPLAPFT